MMVTINDVTVLTNQGDSHAPLLGVQANDCPSQEEERLEKVKAEF